MSANKIIVFLGLSFMIITNGSNAVGQSKKIKKTKQAEIDYTISYCDTVVRQFYRYPEAFTPVITNIDPEIQVTPVTLGDLYCYQIEFAETRLFRNFEIWLNDIKFEFTLNTNNPNCNKVGDKIVCLVDQIQLGNQCLIGGPASTENKFDCIYQLRWTVKVRGVVCDSIYGPFSKELTNVSLQCGK
ncbi:MAG: hypothetical protein ACKVQB_04630 [Bacteroidia bacterium]